MQIDVLDILKTHEKKRLYLGFNFEIRDKKDLSIYYTPGVAEICKEIVKDEEKAYDYTIKRNWIAVVSDGSAVLGLGNIGAKAALPVMEGKSILFKYFGGVDTFPICLETQNADEIIKIVKALSCQFAGINLEDISAPKCFYVLESLQNIGIPIWHDDQQGTLVVVLAALINALKLVNKDIRECKVVISGCGAAGGYVAKFFAENLNFKDIIVCDSKGAINKEREDLNEFKEYIARITNKNGFSGSLKEALVNADIFIGLSKPKILKPEDLRVMNEDAIIFSLSNPIPEVWPIEDVRKYAKIIATGRSDLPNQINNVLAFPGMFRGAIDVRAKCICEKMINSASVALSKIIAPTSERIIPEPLDWRAHAIVAASVAYAAIREGVAREEIEIKEEIERFAEITMLKVKGVEEFAEKAEEIVEESYKEATKL